MIPLFLYSEGFLLTTVANTLGLGEPLFYLCLCLYSCQGCVFTASQTDMLHEFCYEDTELELSHPFSCQAK